MPESALVLDELLLKLTAVKPNGKNYQAQCPAHEDRTASLSVTRSDSGNILVKCFAGCSIEAICMALGITVQQLFAPKAALTPLPKILAVYDYKDIEGQLRYQVVRFSPKDFRQRQPSIRGGYVWNMKGAIRIPYRLPELRGQSVVYIAEGEKDCDALFALGLPATTNVGGAGKWIDDYSETLKSIGVSRCVLLPDNDNSGKEHMTDVARSLKAVGIGIVNITFEGLKAKGDVSDWLTLGHTKDDLEALVSKKPYILPANSQSEVSAPLDPALDPARWPRSDLGAAEAFVDREGENVRFDNAQERWLVWDHHLWRPDTHGMIYRLTHAHIRQWQKETIERVKNKQERESLIDYLFKLERRSGVDNTIAMSKTLLPVADPGDNWDKNAWLMCMANGVVDLKTGKLRDGERSDRITLQTTTTYDASATCPAWENFLREVFEGDTDIIGYIRRALGYSLTGDMREQCFFMCIGAGSNGKSTFLSTLEAVWGKYAYTTDMKTFTTNQNSADQGFDLAELANRRLILASETKSDSRLNEQALKNFTGGEKMNAARKYGHPFEYVPTGKIWMGLNHQPRVKDDSYGFWRRVRIIPFQRIFSGSAANPNLRSELVAEAPGILNWAVSGCLEWQRDGLNQPSKIFNATDAYRDAEDPLADFLLERTEPDSASEISAVGFYKNYVEWAKEQGFSDREMLTAHGFGRNVSRRFEKRHTAQGKRYVGIRVTVRAKDLLSSAY